MSMGANPFVFRKDDDDDDSDDYLCLRSAIAKGNLDIIAAVGSHALALDSECFDSFLEEAIRQNNVEAVAVLMHIGGEASATEYYSPIDQAVMLGSVECIRLLLDHGADIEQGCDQGDINTTLFCAIGHASAMKELLAQGANPQVTDGDGWTPLHYAAAAGCTDVVALLLACNVPIDQQTWFAKALDYTYLNAPLHYAVYGGHQDVVEALLSKRANTELCDNFGRTPLQIAANGNFCQIVEALVASGANIFVTFPNGMTVLHQAAINCHISDIIKTLVLRGIGTEVRCKKLRATPLLYAVGSNCHQAVQALIDCNADLEARDHLNRTPLLLAVGRIQYPFRFSFARGEFVPSGHVYIVNSIIEALLDAGASVDVHDGDLNTPLHIAASKQDADVIELLVLKGANIEAENSEGKTPLQVFNESFYFIMNDAFDSSRALRALQKI